MSDTSMQGLVRERSEEILSHFGFGKSLGDLQESVDDLIMAYLSYSDNPGIERFELTMSLVVQLALPKVAPDEVALHKRRMEVAEESAEKFQRTIEALGDLPWPESPGAQLIRRAQYDGMVSVRAELLTEWRAENAAYMEALRQVEEGTQARTEPAPTEPLSAKKLTFPWKVEPVSRGHFFATCEVGKLYAEVMHIGGTAHSGGYMWRCRPLGGHWVTSFPLGNPDDIEAGVLFQALSKTWEHAALVCETYAVAHGLVPVKE